MYRRGLKKLLEITLRKIKIRTGHHHKRNISTFVFIMFIFYVSMMSFAETKSQHNILFISSYNSRFPTFFNQINGLKSVLTPDYYKIDLEFMDTKRLPQIENTESFEKRLTYKINELPNYDLVIVSDDNAYQFALSHQDSLFNGLPIIFFGVNNLENAKAADQLKSVTGVAEYASIDETISLATTLYPEATSIYAVVDSTLGAKGDYENYKALASNYPSLSFEMIDLSVQTFNEASTFLSTLDRDNLVLLLGAYNDVTGRVWSFEESVSWITNATDLAIFHPYEHGIGSGLLGGYVISHYTQGQMAGQIARDYLENDFPLEAYSVVMESPNHIILDAAVFKSLGLNKHLITDDITWVNKKASFWDQYQTLGILTITFIATLITLISYLIVYIRKAHQIQTDLNQQTIELKDLYDELSNSEENLRIQNESLMNTQIILEQQKTELKRKQKLIEDYAYYDYLTHLPNRHSFRLDVNQLLTKQMPTAIKGAVCFIDIDDFKHVNDQFGHSYGDALLVEISKLLSEKLMNYGKVYRYGGDEFVALITTACDLQSITYIADQLIDTFNKPLKVKDHEYHITFSMGVAIVPLHGNDFDSLVGCADMAMYSAKNQGKNQYHLFDQSADDITKRHHQLNDELMKAIDLKALSLEYQCIYEAKTDHIRFTEAMLRWYSSFGNVSPTKFIPMAKELGLMPKLTSFVLESVFKLSLRINTIDSATFISINLSTFELLNQYLIDKVTELVGRYPIDPSRICFEISEHLIDQAFDTIQKQVSILAEMGFQITIDNFGAEYMSLNYLKKLPVNYVKIDVAQIIDMSGNRNILSALFEILKEMSIAIIIKGVENEHDLQFLGDNQYDYVQGRHYSYPVSEDTLLSMLKDEGIKIYNPKSH